MRTGEPGGDPAQVQGGLDDTKAPPQFNAASWQAGSIPAWWPYPFYLPDLLTKVHRRLPSVEELRKRFSYNPETGAVTHNDWNGRSRNCVPGRKAGSRKSTGHLQIVIDGINYPLHRIIWKISTGEDPGDLQIDHINGVRDDNRISNLRLATQQENNRNQNRVRGVYWNVGANKWEVKVGVDNKTHHCGLFESYEKAVEQAKLVRRILFKDFASNGFEYA